MLLPIHFKFWPGFSRWRLGGIGLAAAVELIMGPPFVCAAIRWRARPRRQCSDSPYSDTGCRRWPRRWPRDPALGLPAAIRPRSSAFRAYRNRTADRAFPKMPVAAD